MAVAWGCLRLDSPQARLLMGERTYIAQSMAGRKVQNRRSIQQSHERAVIRDFLAWFNRRRGTRFVPVAEPNPPDAIIRSTRTTRWIEVVDVFWSGAYARDLYSDATPGETHKPVRRGPYVDMDDQFAARFASALAKKLRKEAYEPFRNQYGPGYLVLCVHHPWFDGCTLERMKEHWLNVPDKVDLNCFREAFVAFYSLNRRRFRKWQVGSVTNGW